jgi:hypothetical protein
VTATRDRRREPEAELDTPEWGHQSAFGSLRGWPWWGAVLLAVGLSILAEFVDMQANKQLGTIFEVGYFIGCVGAVCAVRRRNLFGPMVQAPLIFALTIPPVVLATKGIKAGASSMSKLIDLGLPMVTGFPTMAVTTGVTVVIGGIRYFVQRKPPGYDEDADSAEQQAQPGGHGGRGRADRDRLDRADGRDRAAAPGARRPRPPGSGRPGQDRAAAGEERGAPRDRTRMAPRAGAPGEGGRAGAGGRAGQERGRSQEPGADRRGSDRGVERGQGGDRGQADRGQGGRGLGSGRPAEGGRGTPGGRGAGSGRGSDPQPRGGRPAPDAPRRQPPPRRRDDY